MSVTFPSQATAPAPRRVLWRGLLALAALAIVAGAVALLAWLFAPAAPPLPVRAPFGLGLREAAPAPTGLGGWILSVQASFYQALQGALAAMKANGTAILSLIGLGFAYGVFHAAGPGHGKAVISAYLVANERSLRRGFALSLAAALLQAIVAIALVGIAAMILKVTAATMNAATQTVELVSFAAVAALGLLMTWRKAGKLVGTWILARDPLAGAEAETCDHAHLPPPEAIDRLTRWREWAGVVAAAGMRPCAGAIIVLVFALAQGLFAAGIAATVAMALGTALTTGAIAALAVFAKAAALRLAGGRGAGGAIAIAGVELLAAAFVAVLGASLLAGLMTIAGS